MNQTSKRDPAYEHYAHENSENVEKNERLRAGIFVALIFVIISVVFFQYFANDLATSLTQNIEQLGQVEFDHYVVGGLVLTVLAFGALIRLIKTVNRFKKPTTDKKKGMILIVLHALLALFVIPFLLYFVYFGLLQLGAWPEILSELNNMWLEWVGK